MPSTRSDIDTGTDAGYVTVEAAIMFTALTAVVGLVVAGIVTVASYLGAVDLARDAARAAALDPGDASGAASSVVSQVDADARVSVSGDSGGTGDLITVQITKPGRLFDLSATAVIVAEPVGEGL